MPGMLVSEAQGCWGLWNLLSCFSCLHVRVGSQASAFFLLKGFSFGKESAWQQRCGGEGGDTRECRTSAFSGHHLPILKKHVVCISSEPG